jgi:hypothetical protein
VSELKPCPFCDGEANGYQIADGWWKVHCKTCTAYRSAPTRGIAISAWNFRPREERLEWLLSDIHKRVAKKAMFCAVALEVACGDCPEASTCDEAIIVAAINAALKDEGKE